MAIIFCENINRKIPVSQEGANLLETLLSEGVRVYRWPHNYCPIKCCKADLIEVVTGDENLNPLTGKERAKLKYNSGNLRLAGECTVHGDVTIRIRP